MNLIGFVQALLISIGAFAGLDNPQYKITPVGFTRMLLENPTTAKISNAKQILEGAERELKVRYAQRGLESDVSSIDDCETPTGLTYKETTIGRPLFSKLGIFISDDDMRKYQNEAQTIVNGGNPASPIMAPLYEAILVKINGIIQKMDANLLAAMATSWGKNAVTGSATAQTVNFANSLSMTDGIVKLISDYQFNEGNETPIIVGNGVVANYNLTQGLKSAADQFGFGANQTFRFYNDLRSTTAWGVNHFGVFMPGMIGLVDFNKNVGPYAGEKGGSYFFTMPVPIQLANGQLSALTFDCQLKYIDCPTIVEEAVTVPRGWQLIISKSYGLYVAPADMFAATDRLTGVRGAFHYVGAYDENIVKTQAIAPFVNVSGITSSDATQEVAIGATYDFEAALTVAPADATQKGILYSTADAAIATVSQLGIVTGIAAGEVVITATTVDGSYTANVTVTVPVPVP
ncbi:MAG: Ig domain-containing protein [Paludibacteraceae bacterium]|nr:Ig domain-containing protein [Paludibacteraceae bacterium]